MRRGKRTIWLRFFGSEAKEAVNSLFSSSDLQKWCGIVPYDKKTKPNGNFKKEGNAFYCRKTPKHPWRWFCKVYKLSDVGSLRSADDVDIDTIVFDECMQTPERLKRYRGNPARDLSDIFISMKREHEVKVIFLGNKEMVFNPFLTYFGIKPLPKSWEGIRTFKNGSFAYQQIDNKQRDKNEYDKQVSSLFAGTAYGAYLYEGNYKSGVAFKRRKTPPQASGYAQLYINGQPLKISSLNGFFYVNQRIDAKRRVYADSATGKFPQEFVLVKRQKQFFIGFVNAIADNRVYYDSEATREAIQPFLQWLNI